jgi:hypothetical protein
MSKIISASFNNVRIRKRIVVSEKSVNLSISFHGVKNGQQQQDLNTILSFIAVQLSGLCDGFQEIVQNKVFKNSHDLKNKREI